MKLQEWERQAEANGHKNLGWSARDSQRSKVYMAEAFLHGKRLDREGILALVSKVENSPYVIKNFGSVRHTVDFKRAGATWSHAYRSGRMTFSPGCGEYTVIHELAHTYSVRSTGGHGWLFCAVLLDLVRHFMGQESHDQLKASFKKYGVKFTVPRAKRVMTEEQRVASADRLAKARQARLGAVTEPHAFVVQALDYDGNPIDRWYLVASVSSSDWNWRINITRALQPSWRSESLPYLVRSSDKGIGSMFDKITKRLYGRDYGNLKAIPVSQLPTDRAHLPQDWAPKA